MDAVGKAILLLNQPVIKEGIKNLVGSVTFALGIWEIYDLIRILRGRKITVETERDCPKWVQVIQKIVMVCAKISLIISAGISRPGLFIISSLVGLFFSTEQLDTVFGPNTLFTINPWHPRHLASIAALILAMPALVETLYRGARWIYHKIQKIPPSAVMHASGLRKRNLLNAITSRPVLHLINKLARLVFSR